MAPISLFLLDYLVGTEQMAVVGLGDSFMAHFRIPQEWATAADLNETFKRLCNYCNVMHGTYIYTYIMIILLVQIIMLNMYSICSWLFVWYCTSI